jgi:hypothetical protein
LLTYCSPILAMLRGCGGSFERGSHDITPLPSPWQVEQIPGGFKVLDATGQAVAYFYARDTKATADIAMVLTFDEARRITLNVAKLPELRASKPL